MRTGLGKGITFHDRHIAAAVGIHTIAIEATFQDALANLESIPEFQLTPAAQPVVAEVRSLSIELLAHLKQNVDLLRDVSWSVYEELVAEFFASWGYEVNLVGRDATTSADVIAVRPSDASGIDMRLFIEVKKTKEQIGIDAINAVLGSVYSESTQNRFHAAVLVSDAGFRNFAKISPERIRHLGVELRDGNDVRRWLREYSPNKNGLWLRPR